MFPTLLKRFLVLQKIKPFHAPVSSQIRKIHVTSSEIRIFFIYLGVNYETLYINVDNFTDLRHGEYEWQDPKSEDEVVNITYVDKDGNRIKVRGKVGCQITLTKDLEGMEVQLPKATRNFYVDGHKPKPH
ncbi:hypothetical protein HF086_002581 [Spodoptera exigua]|uniref:Uncharacterized protein n=1 Tax=Spodoptera exigua TaxID=7107 RepID=A0A922SFE2_SPOEX|nr:hypothetical protein HF086_002581 [Spodoptera exigua]